MQYKSGSYFGELALIKDQPRAASILCKVRLITKLFDYILSRRKYI